MASFKNFLRKTAGEDESITFKQLPEESADDKKAAEEIHDAPKAQAQGASVEYKIVRPESMDEIFTIADYVISGRTVVLNLEALGAEEVKRMLDFLNGVVYTIDGQITNASQATYILSPSGATVD